MTCEHVKFDAHCAIARLTQEDGGPVTNYMLQVSVKCADCGMEFEFRGCPDGYSPYGPTVSIDGLTMSVPIMPPGMPIPDNLPGFRVHSPTMDKETAH